MEKTKAQKILQWSTKDIVLNVLTYLLNAVVLVFMFYATLYLDGLRGQTDLNAYFENKTTFVHFVVSLVFLLDRKSVV